MSATVGDRWISRDDAERSRLIEHLDGVPWYEAPVPPRWHRCKPQTRGLFDDIERCACGALRFRRGLGSGLWGDRNSRAKREPVAPTRIPVVGPQFLGFWVGDYYVSVRGPSHRAYFSERNRIKCRVLPLRGGWRVVVRRGT